MRFIPTVAAFALLGTLAGCEAPLARMGAGDAEGSDEATFEADGGSPHDAAPHHEPDSHETEHGSLMGHLIWPRTGAIGGASICVEGAEHCGVVFEDGAFAVHGLHAGVSETVVIRAPGFRPLVIPVEGEPNGHLWMELAMVREDANSRPTHAGSIRFRSYRMDAYSQAVSSDLNWYAFDGSGDSVGKATGPRAQIDGLREGTYDIRFLSRNPLMCSRATGWDGADANASTVPVIAGGITHVEQDCIELGLD